MKTNATNKQYWYYFRKTEVVENYALRVGMIISLMKNRIMKIGEIDFKVFKM